MTQAASPQPAFPPITAATVIAAEGDHVGVQSPSFGSLRARVAVDGGVRPGERVLVAVDAAGAAYVIARLEPREREAVEARARDDGDVEIVAARGRLVLKARDGVHIQSEGDLELEARERVALSSGGGRSQLTLDGERLEARAGLFEAKAARLRVLVEELESVAVHADVCVEQLRQRFTDVRTDADRIVERAKSIYRSAEDLAQTKAGRLRFVAEGALHALAERAHLDAREVFRINAERIHLG